MAHSASGHSDLAEHAAAGPDDYVPHVVPLAAYFGVFFALLVLTGITVGVSYFDFGEANLIIALLVATIKASCVAAIFMHLAYDNKFNAIVLVSGLIFLAIFIAFTSFDVFGRGRTDAIEGMMPANVTNPFDEKVGPKPMVPVSDVARGIPLKEIKGEGHGGHEAAGEGHGGHEAGKVEAGDHGEKPAEHGEKPAEHH